MPLRFHRCTSHSGAYQFRRPSKHMTAGTSNVRTIATSRTMASAMPMPSAFIKSSCEVEKATTMTTKAIVVRSFVRCHNGRCRKTTCGCSTQEKAAAEDVSSHSGLCTSSLLQILRRSGDDSQLVMHHLYTLSIGGYLVRTFLLRFRLD
jgi:hypothetical protein